VAWLRKPDEAGGTQVVSPITKQIQSGGLRVDQATVPDYVRNEDAGTRSIVERRPARELSVRPR